MISWFILNYFDSLLLMANNQGQQRKIIKSNKLNIDYYDQYLSQDESQKIYDILEKDIIWDVPFSNNKRLTQIYADPGLIYEVKLGGYGNRPLETYRYSTLPWGYLPILMEVREKLSQLTGEKYNFCVIQRYPNGKVGISPHRDREMIKGTHICGLSVGCTRKLKMSPPKFIKDQSIELELKSGSLYILRPPTNDYWTHCVEKDSSKAPRISLTFRNVPNVTPIEKIKIPLKLKLKSPNKSFDN